MICMSSSRRLSSEGISIGIPEFFLFVGFTRGRLEPRSCKFEAGGSKARFGVEFVKACFAKGFGLAATSSFHLTLIKAGASVDSVNQTFYGRWRNSRNLVASHRGLSRKPCQASFFDGVNRYENISRLFRP